MVHKLSRDGNAQVIKLSVHVLFDVYVWVCAAQESVLGTEFVIIIVTNSVVPGVGGRGSGVGGRGTAAGAGGRRCRCRRSFVTCIKGQSRKEH